MHTTVEVNISIHFYSADIRIFLQLDYVIDRKIDVTAMEFLLVQNRHQLHDSSLIGSGANGLGIQEWQSTMLKLLLHYFKNSQWCCEKQN